MTVSNGDFSTGRDSSENPDFSLFSQFDIDLFKAGKHYHLYTKLGAHAHAGGTYFAVWAPNAEYVSVVGNMNHWDRARNPMRLRQDHSGIWELFIPEVKKGV